MLRVGLTGGLGSGKSTVAAMLALHGAHVLAADDLARSLMVPGQPVFAAIVDQFGPSVVCPDGTLNRPELARLAFAEGRVEELNAVVHPATIALQASLAATLQAREPNAILVVESALIFETQHGEGWRDRFDRLILVTAPEPEKIARFVARSSAGQPPNPDPHAQQTLEQEARRRLSRMIPDADKLPHVDDVIRNEGTLADLQAQVDALWTRLQAAVPHPDHAHPLL